MSLYNVHWQFKIECAIYGICLQNLTAAVQLVDSVQSPTVDTLFALFDRNQNGSIELCEVSWGLSKLKPQLPLEDARQEALDLFLLFDHKEDRYHCTLLHSTLHSQIICRCSCPCYTMRLLCTSHSKPDA